MYIDPGIGSMVVQALIAVVIAAGGTLVVFRSKVGNLFARWKRHKKEKEPNESS